MAKSAKQAAVALQEAETVFDRNEATEALPAVTGGAVVNVIPMGFKVKRSVVVPSLFLKPHQARVLRFDSSIRESIIEAKKDEAPASVADVTDPQTGEVFTFILAKIVLRTLLETYPNDSYVGKTFYIENIGRLKENKRYYHHKVFEVEQE